MREGERAGVLVIGGAPGARSSLVGLLQKLDIRAIDGTEGVTGDRADRLSDWADVVVRMKKGLAIVWGVWRSGEDFAAPETP